MNERNEDRQRQQGGQMNQQQQQQQQQQGGAMDQQGGMGREDDPIIGRDERNQREQGMNRSQEEADLSDVRFESDMDNEDETSRTGEDSIGR